MFLIASRAAIFFILALVAGPALAQPLAKSAIDVDTDVVTGNTKPVGQQFGYRLVYNCSSTSGPCLNAEVTDLLPAEVELISTEPASPTSRVVDINVNPNFMGSGRTRVQFVFVSPLAAGSSGDLTINVRFPNGTTPDGTEADNTADGINLGPSPGIFPTPTVRVTAVATSGVTLSKTLLNGPDAFLDMPASYRLRINNSGNLNLTAIGPVVDTLHPGTVFNGATPAADCQPGCMSTTPATLTWTSPCAVPLGPGGNCDIIVNVTFPSATFTNGDSVTNEFTADATPLGETPQSFGPVGTTHDVVTFEPEPDFSLAKNMTSGTPSPPTLNQPFSYELVVSNSGNVPLDNLVIIDTLPVELQVTSVTTGAYNGLADFAAGEGVRVSYEKNTALGVFTLWGSSPNTGTNTTLTAPPPGLGAGEYITRIRWEYGPAQPGMAATSSGNRPQIRGLIINPDNAGGPVAIGDSIQNCASFTAVHTPGPTPVAGNNCETFNVSGPFVQLSPDKDNLGGGTVNPGQSITYRLLVRSAPQSSDPVPLENLVATDLLPVNLIFNSWVFNDQGTGLPAPQVFDQIPNFAGTGRTLLRWRWNAGSGNLGVNQQVALDITTTVREGAAAGPLTNDFTLEHDAPGLLQRCSTPSQADAQDLDEDGDTAELLRRESEQVTVSAIAELESGKTIQGTCDGGSVSTSAGTLTGGALEYRLRVENVGTVPMQNFVLIDILPFVGDTGVRDTNQRGSLWTPLLAAPITPPPGTVIYYSTSGNPCRGEVGGPTTSCDPPNWTTVPPDPITSVRSFKVEFGSLVVDPFDFIEFFFSMVTPGNVPPGDQAFNSFAYQADRAVGSGSLTAEPEKVGVALGACDAARLGDFVWVDVNADGVQNDGPTGVNGVYTRLFAPGPDGLPGTLDDVPLSSTVTSNGPDSAPGWYSFPGLAPGSYLVCFTPPPTFVVTTPNQGTDDLDSDVNPATACTHVTTLTPNLDDPTLDAGLIATELAALGNYVWFDRDGNDIQDESPFDGVNGVTVRLWVDDGDGNPEPGTGDVLAATTVTADDVYGQPGYYLFDGLIPGVRYFVQFVLPASATGFTGQDAGGDDTVDSDAAPDGVTQIVFFDPVSPVRVNLTIDAGLVTTTGTLALGDQVWFDTDNDGVFEPENGELGIDNVRLNLYLDDNGDGEPTLDEYLATTTTLTQSGFAGRYLFGNLAPGTYIVVVAPQSFAGGGALAGLVTSTGNDPAPDPDDDVNGDDNGTDVGALTASLPVTLTDNGEPTAEDGNNDTNLTVDFGFINGGTADTPDYDYGDNPDVVSGTAPGDYNTTALDNGAHHRVDVAGSPYLGACVDADGGFNQDVLASQDDTGAFGPVFGTCAGGDDEDGVLFNGPFQPGGVAGFIVNVGSPTACVLNAWVDWDHSGVFGDSAGEQIATDLNVATNTVINPAIPAGAIPGLTYARFRCSSSEGVGATGPAADGEVEDYVLALQGTDFGDAPDTYGTQGAGAASHSIDPQAPLLLGACVDTEADGQPGVPATGDDTSAGTSRVGNCFDDEDGVAFDSVLTACQSAQLTVTSTAGGLLDAWVDFNADGDFGDAGEQVFTGQALAAGANPLSIAVPCTAVESPTYARFRLSSAGGLTPTGAAPDGEVEDYAVNVGDVDLGDAPDTYGTLVASNGPNHGTVTGFSLGATVDSEPDGQPSVGAIGDGADEDGVTIPAAGLVACSAANLSVFLTNTAGINTPRLDAWIDFDGDGAFGDPRDRIATGLALSAGANALPVNVPCDARSAFTYTRFRLTSTGIAGPGGPALDGEVEDWALTVKGLDFGDAPDPTYPTLLASNGARHQVLPAANPTLGSIVDTEGNGQPNAGLTGDDAAGSDDEDGVVIPATLIPGTDGSIQITTGATGGGVSCWIDFNRNGSWLDAGEQVVTDDAIGASTVANRTFPVPVGSPQGTAPVRCRISSVSGLGVTGEAPDGEVEDHPATVGIELPEIGVAKRLVSVTRLAGTNYDVVFEIRVANLGNVPLNGVQVTEDLDVTFAPAASFTVQSVTSPTLTVNPGFDGSANTALLAAGNTLVVGGSGTITLTVRVDSGGNQGPYTNQVLASGTSPGSQIVTDVSQDGDDVDPDDDGDPTDNSDPTVFELPFGLIEIPTVGEWGLILLAGLLGLLAVWRLRS